MRNPATLVPLYNAIADELAFYSNFLEYDSARVEISLEAFDKAAEEAGGESKQLDNHKEEVEEDREENLIG